MQPLFGHDVHFPIEQLLQIHLKSAQIDQASPGLEVHEEVHIAVFSLVTPRDGAEYAYVPRSVLRRDTEDVGPALSQLLEGQHGGSPEVTFRPHVYCTTAQGNGQGVLGPLRGLRQFKFGQVDAGGDGGFGPPLGQALVT